MANGSQKSLAVGILLTFFFGGLGMFYTSIKWGIIGLIVELILVVLCFLFIGIFLLPIWHIASIIITAVSINKQNGH
jgi:hypothetical protein